ncbi:Hsp20/alpha crystallin family protein [Haladaptatus sp. DYF46]|uniref:Hsp20/alpha crystallin family protein n=1 Tax=Haladaptatus sp. DYF46 TaxID=2886041 RepID=UPI001E345AB8|nr:Hsp20/alpha crystallin family protein [Haladaptatus sp. DYF46]
MIEQMHRSMIGDGTFGTNYQQKLSSETNHASMREFSINLTAEPVESGYIVTADLPGFEKDEINLRFEDDILTIRGTQNRSEESPKDVGSSAYGQQRHVYERLRIPVAIDKDAISASYRNGVLEVHLPSSDDSDADDNSRIEIQ